MNQTLHPRAIDLLHTACFLNGKQFMCFGMYYSQLRKADLIDGEMYVTFLGRQFIKHCMDKGYFDGE